MDYTDSIVNALEVMRVKEMQDKQPFKARAYQKVIKGIKDLNKPIHTFEDVAGVTGIGEKLEHKIKEIIETGVLASAEKVLKERNVGGIKEILEVYGIGPAKARELVKDGFDSVKKLQEAVIETPDILNEKQTIGLKYVDDLNTRIPRKEMESHEKLIKKLVKSVDKRLQMTIVGSYRRELADSGDIDVLITMPNDVKKEAPKLFKKLIEVASEKEYLIETLANGAKKCMGIVRLSGSKKKARRIDLLLTPENEYGFAVLYFTGSDKFNVALRKHALTRGISLSEHGFKVVEGDKTIPVLKTEEDILNYLGVKYVEPKERKGDIEGFFL